MFGSGLNVSHSLDTVAHIIQAALTPVFLLSGIGTLLNVFSTRLGRVADQLDKVTALLETAEGAKAGHLGARLDQLKRRSISLDIAVVAAAVGGGATCGATIALFIGALRDDVLASALFTLFGVALICTLIALCAFLTEMIITGRGMRARLEVVQKTAKTKT